MTPAARGTRVLIVEDNPATADSLWWLLSLKGFQVRVAHTGPEGVRAAQEWEPGVVLCDISLPGLDGFGVASALRHGEARLVAITAYGDEETRCQAEENGFDDFLVKPVDPARILQLLA